MRRWEDREKRLETARLKEKALEERGRKRRRVEDSAAGLSSADDEDAEWLLDDWQSSDVDASLSGLSKETQETLARIGLGGPMKRDEDEDLLREDIKVRTLAPPLSLDRRVTLIDLLYLKNTFAVIAVHRRTPPSYVSPFATKVARPEKAC